MSDLSLNTFFVRAGKDELQYRQFLNDLRLHDFVQIIRNRFVETPPDNIMRVFISNKETDEYNDKRICELRSAPGYYISKDGSAGFSHSLVFNETYLKETLILKLSAPVMLLHNLSVAEGWVNGTMATVSRMIIRPASETRLG
ncbi:hypothetical protein BD770DRAFT_36410 [Pilaira anomala]|nr:hypothetical protein BD770DRAFT_36410 [Pilaira anomala]